MHLKCIVAATAVALATTQAHMFISSPNPIEGTDSKSPLDPSGSQFPCQGATLPTTGGQIMAAGSTQLLAFDLGAGDNTAVHGGGSCQLSITYETDPRKQKDPSSWKVIYSIEGGCPTDAPGNLQQGHVVECSTNASTTTACVNEFPFTIPPGVKNGHAIMAWTWFNTIGNREMYMNCMNVELTGGDGSEVPDFPELFVANQGHLGNHCPTTERFNVKFPKPGEYVTTKTEGNPYPLAVPTGRGCSPFAATAASSSTSTSSQTNTKSPPCETSFVSILTTSASSSSSSSSFVTSAVMTTLSTTTITVHIPNHSFFPSNSTVLSSTLATTIVPPSDPASTSSLKCPNEQQVSCPRPGEFICIDAGHFGICDVDQCAISRDVAFGTMCLNGRIVTVG